MAKTVTVNGIDRSSNLIPESMVLVERAFRGQVGMGGFTLRDEGAAYTVPALKSVRVLESEASPNRMFTGFTQQRELSRGPYAAGSDRVWEVECVDLNTILDDYVLATGWGTTNADRAEESDYARVNWLLNHTVLNSVAGVTAGVVPNTNTVTMQARDYRGKTPRDVLMDCAERAHKNFFVYHFSSGPLLFYDKSGGTSLTSSLRITTDAADVDSSTTFGAVEPTLRYDPDRVFSRLRMTFKRGVHLETLPATESTFRRRDRAVVHLGVKTAARANDLSEKMLTAGDDEEVTFRVGVLLPAAQVNDIRAGQRVQVKIAHLGMTSYQHFRVIGRKVSVPDAAAGPTDQRYRVDLEFMTNIRPTRYRSAPKGDDEWEEKSNATDDNYDDGSMPTGSLVVMDRNGLAIYGGGITIYNDSGTTVIIDGTSETFLIAASGSVSVPKQKKPGEVRNEPSLATGLSFNPVTLWTVESDGFAYMLPRIVHGRGGAVLKTYSGAAWARDQGAAGWYTVLRGAKSTTNPPLAAASLKFRVLKQGAI